MGAVALSPHPRFSVTAGPDQFLSSQSRRLRREGGGAAWSAVAAVLPSLSAETHFCGAAGPLRATCSQWLPESSLRNSVPAWSIASVRFAPSRFETTARPLGACCLLLAGSSTGSLAFVRCIVTAVLRSLHLNPRIEAAPAPSNRASAFWLARARSAANIIHFLSWARKRPWHCLNTRQPRVEVAVPRLPAPVLSETYLLLVRPMTHFPCVAAARSCYCYSLVCGTAEGAAAREPLRRYGGPVRAAALLSKALWQQERPAFAPFALMSLHLRKVLQCFPHQRSRFRRDPAISVPGCGCRK